MRISFTNVYNYGSGWQFDILLDGSTIGICTKSEDAPTCEFCTTGLELPRRESEIEFMHEWGKDKSKAQRDIATALGDLLPLYYYEGAETEDLKAAAPAQRLRD